jgi:ABC-type multidrug transport system fused ATPase/permease subunit
MKRDFPSGQRTFRFIGALLREHAGYLAAAILLAGISRGAALVLPVSTRFLVDTVLRDRREDLLSRYFVVVAAATAVQGAAAYFLNSLVARRSHEIACELRMRVVGHVLRLPLAFHDACASGAAATRIANDSDAVRHVLGFPMIELVSAAVTGLISAIVLLRISPALAGIGVVMLLACAAGFAACVLVSRGYVRERSAIVAEGIGKLSEALAGIRTVKAFVTEGREERGYRKHLDHLLANVAETTRLSSGVALARVLIGGSVGVLLIWAGVHEIAHGRLSTGGLLVVLVLWATMAGALLQGGAAAIQISESLAGVDRLRELLAEIREQDEPGRTTRFRSGPGRIVFDNVSFSYGRGVEVLKNISFELAPGTVTALVGASGAGKSTIAAIASCLYTPTSGRVLVDGYDLRTVKLDSYRKQLGIVPQDAMLMSGTVRENILMARTTATDAEFRWACRNARVNEFAERFPAGYETEIGERGVQLSGGQRQRIAIARALLADPRILILDEPTASLDDDSAERVHEALARAAEGRTTILIAHSLAGIRRAQQVLVLENGSIVARGTPAETHLAGRYFPQTLPQGIEFAFPVRQRAGAGVRPATTAIGS